MKFVELVSALVVLLFEKMVVAACLWEQRHKMLHQNYTLKVTEKVTRKQSLPGSLDANNLVLIGEICTYD